MVPSERKKGYAVLMKYTIRDAIVTELWSNGAYGYRPGEFGMKVRDAKIMWSPAGL